MLRHEAFQLTGSAEHFENITLNVFFFSSVGDDSDSLSMQCSSALLPSKCFCYCPGECPLLLGTRTWEIWPGFECHDATERQQVDFKMQEKRRDVWRGRCRAAQTEDHGKQEVTCAFLSRPRQRFHTQSHSLADSTELSAVERLTEKNKLEGFGAWGEEEEQAARFWFVTLDASAD